MVVLTVECQARPSAELWDQCSALLFELQCAGIEEAEVQAPEGERAMVAANEFELAIEPGVLDPPTSFRAYFEEISDAECARREVERTLRSYGPSSRIDAVPEVDYGQLSRASFQPVRVAPFWLIHASWHDVSAEVAADSRIKTLLIEPGMAFGTGTHETTQGCLELLTRAVDSDQTSEVLLSSDATIKARHVLDFGCGSGILAIALKKLHVDRVTAIDIDSLALEATQANAARNGVVVEVISNIDAVDAVDGIVANILKNTLIEFAPKFANWIRPGGFLVLSGLLGEQEQGVREVYSGVGFEYHEAVHAGEWVSLRLVKL